MKMHISIKPLIFIIMLQFLLSGCTTQLAPRYDALLLKGITETNTKIMAFFASVAGGVKASSYSNRKDSYNAIIGAIDALVIQSNARPIPESDFKKKVNTYLDSRGMVGFSDGKMPSSTALDAISKQMVKMKSVDMKKGLKANVVLVFKNAVVISMDQAITYESFLNR